jgi:broad specificity phosphatase PhoE
MKAPGILRRRAPFLTPFWVAGLAAMLLLLVVYLAGRATIAFAAETTTVIVLRHAEKATDAGDDPPLSPTGLARAERLAGLLAAAPLDAVYASDTQRAQQTAAPLAARHRLPVTVRAARDVRGLIGDIGDRHVGRSVVVVGHSNTVPEIVSALTRGKQAVAIADDEFDRIFIVTVTRFGPPSTTELRY